MKLKLYRRLAQLLLASMLLHPVVLLAAGFSAGISPPKFELKTNPGKIVKEVITILNTAGIAANYSIRTADWRLNEQQGVDFIEDKLVENSCRPWVRLEQKSIQVRSGAQKKYRFEIHTAKDAKPGLCKFAILIEPDEKLTVGIGKDQNIKFPVVGRYAVIVYLNIGDVKADIEYLGMGKKQANNLLLPTLKFYNKGVTYGRAFGSVVATDAKGKRYDLLVSSFPVLPGRTEEVLLAPNRSDTPKEKIKFNYPLKLKGKIEIGGKTFKINETFYSSS